MALKKVQFERDPEVPLDSFGFKKVKKNLKAVRAVSVPMRFGSLRFSKRFGSMSAIRALPESNSNERFLSKTFFFGITFKDKVEFSLFGSNTNL